MICVDSSVAVKWLVAEPDSPRALSLLRHTIDAHEEIVAPILLISEVANVLWQQVRRGSLLFPQVLERLQYFRALPLRLESGADIALQALMLTEQYRLPAVYDAHYLVVASGAGAQLWTADQRLLNALGGRLPFVRSLTTYR